MSEAPTTSYGVPRIDSVEGPGSTNASTYGGELVRIRGANFGPAGTATEPSYLEVVSVGTFVRWRIQVILWTVLHVRSCVIPLCCFLLCVSHRLLMAQAEDTRQPVARFGTMT
jgi:hypothetical protein